MANKEVRYNIVINTGDGTVQLRNLATGSAETKVALAETETAVTGVTEAFSTMRNQLVGLVAVYAGWSTLKDSYELFNKQELAVTKLSSVYQDNAKYTNENLETLEELSIKEEKLTGTFRENIDAMEGSILAHHDIKLSMEQIIPTVLDYAAATGTTSVEAMQQFSRAVGNPLRASQLLRQAHIDITKAQSEWMTNMYNSGHYLEYQTFILNQFTERYKGTAAKMLADNPGLQIELQFRQAQTAIGELEKHLLIDFEPAIGKVIGELRDSAHWMGEHKQAIESLIGIVIKAGEVYAVWWGIKKAWVGAGLVYNGYLAAENGLLIVQRSIKAAVAAEEGVMGTIELSLLNIKEGLITAIAGETAATTALGTAMDVALGPVGLLVLAISGLAGGYALLHKNTDDASAAEDRYENAIKDRQNAINTTIEQYKLLNEQQRLDISLKDEAAVKQLQANIANLQQGFDEQNRGIYHDKNGKYRFLDDSDLKRLNAMKSDLSNYTSVLAAYWKIDNTPSVKSGRDASSFGGTGIPDPNDMKGEKHTIITWNVKNFGIGEQIVHGTQEAGQKAGESVLDSLLAAQRDYQTTSESDA